MRVKIASLEIIELEFVCNNEDEAIELFAKERGFESVDDCAAARGLFASELRDHLLIEQVGA